MRVRDIVEHLESYMPIKLAENFDSVGLLVGEMDQEVKKVYLTLTPTMEVIEDAINKGADMIIAHHPYSLNKFSSVTSHTTDGRKIIKLIQNGISLYAAHTNLDKASDTINEILCNKLSINTRDLFIKNYKEPVYKLAVYVPKTHADYLRISLLDAGAGHIGNYSHCSFSTEGQGTFKPLENSTPTIGAIGHTETVDEIKIETVMKKENLNTVIKAMKLAHPYEEVAYDLYQLAIDSNVKGYGLIGHLEKAISFGELIELVKDKFQMDHLSYVGSLEKKVQSVVICSGSATDFMDDVIKSGVDVFITGDVRYHYAIEAQDNDLCVIDATHFHTEKWVIEVFVDLFAHMDIEIIKDTISTNPIQIV